MQEYWINVYRNPINNLAHLGASHIDKEFCIKCSKQDDWVTIYRIHVKMKPVKRILTKVGDRSVMLPIHESWKWI